MEKKKPLKIPQPAIRERIALRELFSALKISRKSLEGLMGRGDIPADCFVTGIMGLEVVDLPRAIECGQAALARHKAPIGRVVAADQTADDLLKGVDMDDPKTWPVHGASLGVVKDFWDAMSARRKDRVASAELLDATAVRNRVFEISRRARDKLLRIPEASASDLAAAFNVEDASLVTLTLRTTVERIVSDFAAELAAVVPDAPT